MQVALVEIGTGLGFRTYVARNDQGILVKNRRLGEHPSVVTELGGEQLVSSYKEAASAGALIDCIWFKNAKYMPAVIEIEYTTGVTSGLSRMLNFKDRFIPLFTRYVIAAPDEQRDKVVAECSKEQFKSLGAKFLPFSAIQELYALHQRGRLKNVNQEFLDNFLESPQAA